MEANMDAPETIEPGVDKGPKRRVGRSPAYPSLPVSKAIEQARALHAREGDYAAPVSSALEAWGYGPKSSGGRQTLATMKYYGLIDVTGEGDTRMVKVSEIARRIILDQREDDTEKRQLIRHVAMMPSAHKALYKTYPTGLASDSTVTHFLIFDQGFNKDAAKELIAEFKQTASYVGLYEPQKSVDKVLAEDKNAGDNELPTVKEGDRIQWTSQGADQFPEGALVLGLSEDGQWIFTDQSDTAVPLKEVSVMEQAQPAGATVAPPPVPAHLLRAKGDEAPKPGSRRAIFPLDEGDVTLVFPEGLSASGLTDLGDYLNIFLKKERAKAANSKTEGSA
jgi:hypothetical protein